MPVQTRLSRWFLFFIVVGLITWALLVLPPNIARMSLVFIILAVVLAFVGYRPRHIFALISRTLKRFWARLRWRLRDVRRRYRTSQFLLHFSPLPRYQIALELTFIVAIALITTQALLPYDTRTRLEGIEHEWITGMGYIAHLNLQEYGYLPLWNSHYRAGEPMIGNAVSYLTNPFSSFPVLIWGLQGIKWAVVLGAMLAGVGGWILGRVLGLGIVGRILLGVLLIGKGNMHAMLSHGYYQLGLQQVYFPYIMAGTIAVMRSGGRWAVVLTGLMTALLFMAGNVWYILPMLIVMACIVLVHTSGVPSESVFNHHGWRKMIVAGIFTLGISAVYTLPVLLEFDRIGNHGDECRAGWEAQAMWRVPALYFVDDYAFASDELRVYLPCSQDSHHSAVHFHYSFVMPYWAVAVLFLLIPPIVPYLHLPALAHERRIWWALILIALIMTLWGAGGSPLWLWLYEQIELLRGWRFVGRAMAVGAFVVAVMIAMRADGLARAIMNYRGRWRWFAYIGLVALLIAGSIAPLSRWSANPARSYHGLGECLADWRAEDTVPRDIWMQGYSAVWAYIDHGLALNNIESEFFPLPSANTLGNPDMWFVLELAEYAVMLNPASFGALNHWRYEAVTEVKLRGLFCLFRQPEYGVPYAFTVPRRMYDVYGNWGDLRTVATILDTSAYQRHTPDTVSVILQPSNEERVLTIRELAYAGWEVWLNGERAPLEVAGGMNSIIIPPGSDVQTIVFAFRPPLHYLGSAITIISVIGAILYLLLPFARRNRHNIHGIDVEGTAG